MKAPIRTIRQKLGFILAVTTLIALTLAGVALMAINLRARIAAIETDLVTQADIIALASSAALAFDDRQVATENLRVLRAKHNVVAAALYDASGAMFAAYSAGAEPPLRASGTGVAIEGEWVRVWRPVMGNAERVGTVFVQARHEVVARALEYLGVLIVVLGSSLLGALLISNRLQRMITVPIQSIRDVARRITEGRHFDLRAPRTSDDEIAELVDAFNAMLDELEQRARTREAALEALRVSDERYQLAVRGSSAGLWDWDMRANTMIYSPRIRAALGYSEEEFPNVPSSLIEAVHPDDRVRVRAALREHLTQDTPYSAECRLHLKSGEWRWFHITGMSQKDAAGRAFRMAGSISDVTERKHAEQVLHEANRAKDEFIATLAHELRNPLAPIRTGLEILKKDRQNGPHSVRARETMERQLAHMIRLIDDLLDISRINSGKIRLEKARMNLQQAVETAVEVSRPAIDAKEQRLEIDLPAQPVQMIADATRIAQALGNLLHNAAKYTPPRGHIVLRARQQGEWAEIEVADDGVGIPPDMLEGIFHLFTQVGRTLDRAQGGLGIGLYLVRSLVELHGGTVTAASAGPGRGSKFTVRLPCLAAPASHDGPAGKAAAAAAPAGTKVLVVDDNVDAADTLCTVLELSGRNTRAVHDGRSVLQAAREFGPDVILLDIGLPGMNGYEVARQLRSDPRFAHTHIVAVTGWGSEEDRRRSREAGFDAHLTKPIELDALEPLLRRAAPATP